MSLTVRKSRTESVDLRDLVGPLESDEMNYHYCTGNIDEYLKKWGPIVEKEEKLTETALFKFIADNDMKNGDTLICIEHADRTIHTPWLITIDDKDNISLERI